MRFVVGQKLAGSPAAKLFEFFCELAGDAKLAVRHDVDAGFERFRETMWRFKEDCGFVACSGCPELTFALPTFDREKSEEAKLLCRESRTD